MIIDNIGHISYPAGILDTKTREVLIVRKYYCFEHHCWFVKHCKDEQLIAVLGIEGKH